jgi:hypothetical protein
VTAADFSHRRNTSDLLDTLLGSVTQSSAANGSRHFRTSGSQAGLIHVDGGVGVLLAQHNGGGARDGRRCAGCATVFGMDVKALVWLGVPVDDVAAAVGFFAGALALDRVFEEADTVELSAANGDKIQLSARGTAILIFVVGMVWRCCRCLRWPMSIRPAPRWPAAGSNC